MEFRDIVTDRLEGMYSLIESSNSVILEDFKNSRKDTLKEGEKAFGSFFNFVKKKDPNKVKQPNKLVAMIKRKSEEFQEWAKEHPKLAICLLAIVTMGAISSVAGQYYDSLNGQNNAMHQHMQQHQQSDMWHQQAHQHANMMHMQHMGMM